MSAQPATVPAVRRTVTVARPVEEAFRVFTEEMDSWWPLETHSIAAGEEDVTAEGIVLEGREGGRMYERMTGGAEGYWGTVLVWDPPHRLVISWTVNPEAPAPTELEITFTPDGDGARVELEHRGWERLGERAQEAREGYDAGWEKVLGGYARVLGGEVR